MLTHSGFEASFESDFERIPEHPETPAAGTEIITVEKAANVTHYDRDSRHQRRMRRERRQERGAPGQGSGWSVRLW